MATADIRVNSDGLQLVVANVGNQTYHLRCMGEDEQKSWVAALRYAKSKAMIAQKFVSDGAAINGDPEYQIESALQELSKRFRDLERAIELMNKRYDELSQCPGDTHLAASSRIPTRKSSSSSHGHGRSQSLSPHNVHSRNNPSSSVDKRVIAYQEALSFVMKFVHSFHDLAHITSKRFKEYRDHRIILERMVEDIAKQHRHLEKTLMKTQSQHFSSEHPHLETAFSDKDSSDDESYYDATETLGSTGASAQHPCVPAPDDVVDEYESEDERSLVLCKKSTSRSSLIGVTSKLSRISSNKPSVRSKKESISLPIRPKRVRRSSIPHRPDISINLWSFMKNCIGKDLSKIPMPVNFCEPLSMLQRLTEDYEYSKCLDKAAESTDSIEAMAHVAAFAVSSYASTHVRTNKPFNPLFMETFECDRTDDLGWRLMSEQISHHPPVAAMYCEGRQWYSWQDFTMTTKFRGKYIQLDPQGSAHAVLRHNKHHYMWNKVQSTVHNIIVGKLWIDNAGDMEVINVHTGERCQLHFKAYSYFSGDAQHRVSGHILDADGQIKYTICGTWNKYVEGARGNVMDMDEARQRGVTSMLWEAKPLPPDASKMYHFSSFTMTLNEPESDVAPTDSRWRPDQRLMEEGKWDEANLEKQRLEQNQRLRLRLPDCGKENDQKPQKPQLEPLWFHYVTDEETGVRTVKFNANYWQCKANNDWKMCPNLFK